MPYVVQSKTSGKFAARSGPDKEDIQEARVYKDRRDINNSFRMAYGHSPEVIDSYKNIVPVKVLSQSDYEELKERVEWLECLEAAGVDNWEGYDHAADILREMEDYP